MNVIANLLFHEIDEFIAIIITKGSFEKGFYEGILKEVNEKDIVIEIISTNNYIRTASLMSFEYDTFILATPLDRYQ